MEELRDIDKCQNPNSQSAFKQENKLRKLPNGQAESASVMNQRARPVWRADHRAPVGLDKVSLWDSVKREKQLIKSHSSLCILQHILYLNRLTHSFFFLTFHAYCKEKKIFFLFSALKNIQFPALKKGKKEKENSEKTRSYSLSLSFYILKIIVQVWEEAGSLLSSTGLK